MNLLYSQVNISEEDSEITSTIEGIFIDLFIRDHLNTFSKYCINIQYAFK